MRLAPHLALVLLAACTPGEVGLIIDLRTDLTPGEDFFSVETRLDGERLESIGVVLGQNVIDGARIAEYGAVTQQTHEVSVALIDAAGPIVSRRVIVDVRESTGFTVLITRNCVGTVCPRPTEAASFTECHGGRCVDPACSPEAVEACGASDCSTDGDCPGGAACAEPRCVAGACLLAPDDAACAMTERCDVIEGCVEVSQVDGGQDASADTGAIDTGLADSAPTDSGGADTSPADTGVLDTGSTDSGAGDTTTPSCDAVFGSIVPGYVLCAERATECEFHADPMTMNTCDVMCVLGGSACLAAYSEGAPVCTRDLASACDASFRDGICVCAR